jgi:hypothetical protein
MTVDSNSPPSQFDTAVIIDHYDLRFDAGDRANGSLYLCTPRGSAPPDAALDLLRASGLWSADAEKSVAEDQRQAYKDGLRFVAAAAYRAGVGHVVLARFDHPKFPSDAARWQAWLACFDAAYERIA